MKRVTKSDNVDDDDDDDDNGDDYDGHGWSLLYSMNRLSI